MPYVLTFLSTGLIQGMGVITGILTARLLGPAGKGDLTTVFWLPAVLTTAGIMGLPQAVAFQVSRNRNQDQTVTAMGFWLGLGLGVAEAVALYPLMPWVVGPQKQHLVTLSRWFLLYVPLSFSSLTLLGIDQGRQSFIQYNVLRILPVLLYVFGILLAWHLQEATVITVVAANLVAQFAALCIRGALSGKSLFPQTLISFIADCQRVLKAGIAFHLPALAGAVLIRADVAILIHTVSSEEIGYYSVAISIAMAQIGLTSSIVEVNFPKIARLGSHGAPDSMLRQFRLAQPAVAGVSLAVALTTPWMVRHLFGVAFLPAVFPTLVLILAFALRGLNEILDNGLRAMGHCLPGTLANSVGVIVLVAGGYSLTRHYGIAGMALGVVSASLVVFLWLLVCSRNILRADWKSFVRSRKEPLRIMTSRFTR